jgi:DNA mismatch endonuclease (patch repair protein)
MRTGQSSIDVRERIIDGYRLVYDAETARRMGGIRQKDTAPEIAVRRILAALGLRYRVRNRDLPGSPDIANRGSAWAVFVHGCYWHRHSRCPRATTPRRNGDFWNAKLGANVARDRRAIAELQRSGFQVLTIWECQTKQSGVVLSIVTQFMRRLGQTSATMPAAPRIEGRTARPLAPGAYRRRRPAR